MAEILEFRRRQQIALGVRVTLDPVKVEIAVQHGGEVARIELGEPALAGPANALALRPAAAPLRTARVSRINPAFPVYGTPTTVTVRNNFQAAKDEIEELQADKLDLAGGVLTGPIVFVANQIIDGGTF